MNALDWRAAVQAEMHDLEAEREEYELPPAPPIIEAVVILADSTLRPYLFTHYGIVDRERAAIPYGRRSHRLMASVWLTGRQVESFKDHSWGALKALERFFQNAPEPVLSQVVAHAAELVAASTPIRRRAVRPAAAAA